MPHAVPTAHDQVAPSPSLGIIVHSHLRWDFVWQRPQQLLSRLSRTHPVLFVEEPILLDDLQRPTLDLTTPWPNVVRAVPRLPRQLGETYDDAVSMIRELVDRARNAPLLQGKFSDIVQWFYTPMPAPEMLGGFPSVAVVYDCMDELAQFRFAPTDLVRRERLLLSRADVVFTGGYRLFESKSRYHDNVHFFGCGVDADHFGAARRAETEIPSDADGITGPVLGYFGVIDERLDYDLIRALAEFRPDWTILMIGPVVKVDPRDLPSAPNIRWLGQRPYAQLPAYVKRFDVCLMPFALNEATEYINPTKTLEYMATGKPIVSTAVADVVRNFTPVVHVARSHAEFVAACTEAAEGADDERIGQGIARAAEESWETIVSRMETIIREALAARAQEEDVEEVLGGQRVASEPADVSASTVSAPKRSRAPAADAP
jgi:glycosyltransferase involved in cell wall biosynthesis